VLFFLQSKSCEIFWKESMFKLWCSRDVKRGLNLGKFVPSVQNNYITVCNQRAWILKHTTLWFYSLSYMSVRLGVLFHENYSCTVCVGKVTKIIFRTQTNEAREGFFKQPTLQFVLLSKYFILGINQIKEIEVNEKCSMNSWYEKQTVWGILWLGSASRTMC
jgi:hypothetical protein